MPVDSSIRQCIEPVRTGSNFSMRINSRIIISCLFILFSWTTGQSQVVTVPEDNRVVKVSTSLLNVPVIVSDTSGRRISGLKRGDFRLRVNSRDTEIDFFADSSEPVFYAIVIDTSGSTRPVIGAIKRAAKDFVSALKPEDKGIVVSFDESVHFLTREFSSDVRKIRAAINDAPIAESPGSVMHDALSKLAETKFASVKGRKAIVVLTDGDVDGKLSNESLKELFATTDIVVYPIFFQTRPLLPKNLKSITFREFVEVEPVKFLNTIAKLNGGRLIVAEAADFTTAFQNITLELSKQYVIGFYVEADGQDNQQQISISVIRPDATIRTKQSVKIIKDAADQ